MVDVSPKGETEREAVASGRVVMRPETLEAVVRGETKKGDVLSVARIAGIQGAKMTSRLIPLAHPLRVTSIEIDFQIDRERSGIGIRCRAAAVDRTGVEMEALCGVAAAALTIYDMSKALDRGMVISDIRLEKKTGGKSGAFTRKRA